jgi:putative ABC transport system permease protein
MAMLWAQRLWLRLQTLFRRERAAQLLDDELQFHLDEQFAENVAAGMSLEEARYAAKRVFGNSTLLKEEARDSWGWISLEQIGQDLRYGIRILRKSPGFTSVAVLTLALGIGANTAIFELVNAIRYRTIPVKDPSQLAIVRVANNFDNASGNFTSRHPLLTYALWREIEAHQEGFSKIFVWSTNDVNLAKGGQKHFAQGLWVSGDFFETLDVRPLIGRLLAQQDDQTGCGQVNAVISYAFWRREYGGDPSIVGQQINVNDYPAEIVGVTPQNFYGIEVGKTFDVAIPLCSEDAIHGEQSRVKPRDTWWLAAMGRLKPGWRITKASAQLTAISPAMLKATLPTSYDAGAAKTYLEFKFAAFPADTGFSLLREEAERPLQVLMGMAGLMLLITCANVANLMLARGSSREREMAVRLAMGAPRNRLIRQLLSEGLVLMVFGTALGVVLADYFSRVLLSLIDSPHDPIFLVLKFDWRVLAFTTALALGTLLIFGLVPALRTTETSPGSVLKSASKAGALGHQHWALRRILVISQVAFSLVLLVASLMFVRSLRNLLTLDPGFRPEHLLLTRVDFSHLNLPKERRSDFMVQLVARAKEIPGVDAVSEVRGAPMTGNGWDGAVLGPNSEEIIGVTERNRIAPDYFHTIETPVLAGRELTQGDALTSPPVAIVNEVYVKKFFHGQNALGKIARLEALPGQPPDRYEIVGVVKDTKYMELREEFPPTLYVPIAQSVDPGQGIELVMRSEVPMAQLVPELRSAMAALNPEIELNSRIYETLIRESLLPDRAMAELSTFFGALALLLAAMGLYGVISYMVARRTSEIGIRMALGAQKRDILSMVLREAGVLLCVGLVAGSVISFALARVTASLFFGLKANDPSSIALGTVVLAAIALFSTALPARRAADLDPTLALQEE